ncbi:MAG TPA: DNA-binding transcriptional regulator Fis [Steroidobacteraceae bacterium]|jgi:Fis family transcriptional regulator|nr:DNA-binding transcriptional regulator Fis [Steroidobacteraceae bacterium]
MTAKNRALASRRPQYSRPVNGHAREIPLRDHTEQALNTYFDSLNGHRPGRLYELVMREVEQPLFQAVMDYAHGNQSRAANILGINRGTLRKKLREYGLSA